MKNYYDDQWFPTIEASEFDSDDKKTAISAFSRCHMALLYYLLVASLVVSVVVAAATLLLTESALEELISSNFFYAGIQILGLYVIGFPLFCFTVRKMQKSERDKASIPLGEFISLLLITLAIMQLGAWISQYVSTYLSDVLNFATPSNTVVNMLQGGAVIPTVVIAVVFAPIFEELIFRKMMIDRLSIYGDRLAVIVTAVSFGLMHGNISQLFYATMAGFVLGHLYTKTHRIGYNIVLHMLVNLFGTLPSVVYYFSFGETPAGGIMQPEEILDIGGAFLAVMIVQAVLVAIGCVLLVLALFRKKYHLSRKCDIEIPKLSLLRVVALNRGTILFFIYSVASILLTFLMSEMVLF